jgi:hypothetical protein
MTLTQTVVDSTYSVGYNVKTGWDVVEYHLDTKNLPVDPTGVYFVLVNILLPQVNQKAIR